ncbi:MAG: glutathione S-transferase family protein [Kofleriaceae bacterium]
MSYTLYTIAGAPRPWRVALGLVAKGLPFTSVVLEASKQEQKAPAFLAINPRGRTPVLADGDFVLTESIAILAYLERAHPAPALFGTTTAEHARIWEQAMSAEHHLREATGALVPPLFAGKATDLVAQAGRVLEELERFEVQLGRTAFLCTETMSAADCVAFPDVRLVLRATERSPEVCQSLGLHPFASRLPRTQRWLDRIEALPGYGDTFPAHWRK